MTMGCFCFRFCDIEDSHLGIAEMKLRDILFKSEFF